MGGKCWLPVLHNISTDNISNLYPYAKKLSFPVTFLWQPIQCSRYLLHGKILGLTYFVNVQGFKIISKNFNWLNSFKLFQSDICFLLYKVLRNFPWGKDYYYFFFLDSRTLWNKSFGWTNDTHCIENFSGGGGWGVGYQVFTPGERKDSGGKVFLWWVLNCF